MKTLLSLCLAAVGVLTLSSCGECNCNSYNKDYLRDVPVSSSRSFN
ncbi:MAG: CGxCxC motif mini-lipoprotein [Akkermansia sp.]